MKCFRIDEGGEVFHYAAETKEDALKEHHNLMEADPDGAEIRELDEIEMEMATVGTEDDDQYPNGNATLKQVFENELKVFGSEAHQLCSTVY